MGAVLMVPVLFVVAYYAALWKIHGFDPRFLEMDACMNAGGVWTKDGGCDASASLHSLQDHLAELIRAGEPVRPADPSWAKGMGQVATAGYAIGDVSFAILLQPNQNTPLPLFKEGDMYGILARRGAGVPEYFLRYSRPEEGERPIRMNPVDLFLEHGQLIVSLVDDRGAGSGEGNLLRLASADGGWTWGTDGCFSYVPEAYAIGRDRLARSSACLIPYVPGLLGAGPEEVQMKEVSYAFQEEVEGVSCTAKGSYPEVQPTSGLSEDTRASMNTQIASRVVEALSGFGDGKEMAADPGTAAQAFVGSCVASTKDLAEDDRSLMPSAGWYSDLSVMTERNGAGYLSLTFRHDVYTGGAHPNTVTRVLVFSLATGNEIGWKEWVEKDHVMDFAKAVAHGVLSETDGETFSEAAVAYQTFLSRPTREGAESLLNTYGEYALLENGVRALFDPYEVAPYASGPIEFLIPRSELEGVILF